MSREYEIMVKSLRKELKKRGNFSIIAERAGVTLVEVSRVLNGHKENDHVINKAIELRDEIRLKQQARDQRLAKVLGS